MSSVGSAEGKISVRARKRNNIYDPDDVGDVTMLIDYLLSLFSPNWSRDLNRGNAWPAPVIVTNHLEPPILRFRAAMVVGGVILGV
jgi:hypothetical protein